MKHDSISLRMLLASICGRVDEACFIPPIFADAGPTAWRSRLARGAMRVRSAELAIAVAVLLSVAACGPRDESRGDAEDDVARATAAASETTLFEGTDAAMGARPPTSTDAPYLPPATPDPGAIRSQPQTPEWLAYPAPQPEATVAAMPGRLAQAIQGNDAELLASLMGPKFTTQWWSRRGADTVDRWAAAERILADWSSRGRPVRLETIARGTVDEGRQDMHGLIDPDHVIVDAIRIDGWGEDGDGEAVFYVAQTEDGDAYLAGRTYGKEGFVGIDPRLQPTTRTVSFATRNGVQVGLDIPRDWYLDSTGANARITTFRPWAAAIGEFPAVGGCCPAGETLISVRDALRDPITMQAAAADVTYFDAPPDERRESDITLTDGRPAILGRYRFGSSEVTMLWVGDAESDNVVIVASCTGEQESCEPVLRSLRLNDVPGPALP